MKEKIRMVQLDPIDYGLTVKALYFFREALIRENFPVEDLNSLILRIIDSPSKGRKALFDEGR